MAQLSTSCFTGKGFDPLFFLTISGSGTCLTKMERNIIGLGVRIMYVLLLLRSAYEPNQANLARDSPGHARPSRNSRRVGSSLRQRYRLCLHQAKTWCSRWQSRSVIRE